MFIARRSECQAHSLSPTGLHVASTPLTRRHRNRAGIGRNPGSSASHRAGGIRTARRSNSAVNRQRSTCASGRRAVGVGFQSPAIRSRWRHRGNERGCRPRLFSRASRAPGLLRGRVTVRGVSPAGSRSGDVDRGRNRLCTGYYSRLGRRVTEFSMQPGVRCNNR